MGYGPRQDGGHIVDCPAFGGLRDRRTLIARSIADELPNDYHSLLVVVVVVVVMPNHYHMVVVVAVVAVMPIRLLRKSADCEEHK